MSSSSRDPLIDRDIVSADDKNTQPQVMTRQKVSKRALVTLFILVYINLLNYMDRFTVSSKSIIHIIFLFFIINCLFNVDYRGSDS